MKAKQTEGKTMQIEIELAEPATPNPAIAGWLLVADEAERAGLTFAANMYRRTARSIEIKQETGVAVCACCFKPFGQGTLHH
ncbi:hypothetical protein [Pseudomonas sp. D3-10]|uniref:hypothetical protein n=1 Tax=Pseudomonas sp. D3-10 TaxID=2817392 RepID=UPI003DA9DD9E